MADAFSADGVRAWVEEEFALDLVGLNAIDIAPDVDLDLDRLAYYRCTRALVDLVDWGTWAADPSRPESQRAEARSIVDGLMSPTGLVTLALRSARP